MKRNIAILVILTAVSAFSSDSALWANLHVELVKTYGYKVIPVTILESGEHKTTDQYECEVWAERTDATLGRYELSLAYHSKRHDAVLDCERWMMGLEARMKKLKEKKK